MEFDDFLRIVGELGPYQRRLYALLSLPAVANAMMTILLVVFLFSIPLHRCAIPGVSNDTYQIQNEAHAHLINQTIPLVSDNHGNFQRSSCDIYSHFNETKSSNVTEPCTSYVYDKEFFISTISESMDFVCEKKVHTTHAKMLTMVGQLIGSLIGGPLSDLFGRRTVILAAMFTSVATSICLTWVTSFEVLIPVVILIMSGYTTMYITSFVYSMEIVGPSKRTVTGVAMNLFWSAGNMIIALLAFLLREWKTRQLVAAVPCVILVYLFFLPESPRWLLCRGRRKEARKTLEKMAERNNIVISSDDLDSIKCVDESDKEPFWKLLKSPIMLGRLSIICYCWFAIGMGFYGLSMNVTNLSGNIYLNFFIFVLVEACAYVICLFLLDRTGRKLMLCATMLLAGLSCILTFVPLIVSDHPVQWVVNLLACIGNTCVSASFAAVYVFSAELLPTTSRNFGMGLSSVICRVGSLLSPYINDLTLHISGRYSQILPMLIFGGVTGLAGLLALLLPETQNKRLPETITDAERLGRKSFNEEMKNDCRQDKLLEVDISEDKDESNM